MALTDDEFLRQFYAQGTHLKKIQLAIRENRFTIWTRNPPNFPEEYLSPILALPDNTPVYMVTPRKSGGPGLSYVLVLKYIYREMGLPVAIYLKGYFELKEPGNLVISFAIQSLKDSGDHS